jgi:phosphopantetheinyl transferase (holo-ACP synthase)
MVGNDVIDLRDPETAPGSEHPRFDGRVFAPAERELLGASTDPRRLRWILWAAKEAAYKVARKIDARAVFSPSRFLVDRDACEVLWEGTRLRLDVDVDSDRVHAVATAGDSDARLLLRAVGVADDEGPGAAARGLALRALAPLLDLATEDLRIDVEDRIPRLRARGRLLEVDLSLSHHGRFVAFSAMLSTSSLAESAPPT